MNGTAKSSFKCLWTLFCNTVVSAPKKKGGIASHYNSHVNKKLNLLDAHLSIQTIKYTRIAKTINTCSLSSVFSSCTSNFDFSNSTYLPSLFKLSSNFIDEVR